MWKDLVSKFERRADGARPDSDESGSICAVAARALAAAAPDDLVGLLEVVRSLAVEARVCQLDYAERNIPDEADLRLSYLRSMAATMVSREWEALVMVAVRPRSRGAARSAVAYGVHAIAADAASLHPEGLAADWIDAERRRVSAEARAAEAEKAARARWDGEEAAGLYGDPEVW